MMMVFPDAEGPNSLERSTLIVSVVPSTVISTFFMMVSSPPVRLGEPPQRIGLRSIGTAEADYIGSLIIDSSRYGESVESSEKVECPLFQHDVSAARRVAQYIARHPTRRRTTYQLTAIAERRTSLRCDSQQRLASWV